VVEDSFERMKLENQKESKKINYMKINDPEIGFEHELSFDINN
jgi:hypothetical protein